MLRSEADIEAALDALVVIEPRFAAVRDAAAPIPLRSIPPGFAGLAWVVIGQQISTLAARAIHDRLVTELGTLDAAHMTAADDEALRRAGLSKAKVKTLRAVAAAVLGGQLDFSALQRLPSEEAVAALLPLPGIGRWTAESYLLFALGHRDVFPAADIALQEAARHAFALPVRPAVRVMTLLAETWRPERAVAARLLWAYYRVTRRPDFRPVPV